ncbi:MAG TPA: hypothetical protein VN643_17585 [Pyrinomonadaceae bacterium]|nr:hypothetical protein [Pyrinomonadaceae bacterium]
MTVSRLPQFQFPSEFSDLLTARGLQILKSPDQAKQFHNGEGYFANYPDLLRRREANACMRLLDEHFYDFLRVEQRKIPPESITMMKENYSDTLNKTMHIKTACLNRKGTRAYGAAEKLGLVGMMRSESFVRFAEAVTGFKLDRELNMQVSCYEQGDYAGPHNDHHPEYPSIRNGYIDFHVMFANNAVDHHYLVYEEKGHFSRIVDINVHGAISVYKLPFWHFTTPLAAKPGKEARARRWLLLGSFVIV